MNNRFIIAVVERVLQKIIHLFIKMFVIVLYNHDGIEFQFIIVDYFN